MAETKMSHTRNVITIGQWYSEATDNRSTTITRNGKTFEVTENYWKKRDEWNVTLEQGEWDVLDSEEDLLTWVIDIGESMRILNALGYELDFCDEGMAVWVKDA